MQGGLSHVLTDQIYRIKQIQSDQVRIVAINTHWSMWALAI
jgi:hypothetical protein